MIVDTERQWRALVADVRTGELDWRDRAWYVSVQNMRDGAPRATVAVLQTDGSGVLYDLAEPTPQGVAQCVRRVTDEAGVPPERIIFG